MPSRRESACTAFARSSGSFSSSICVITSGERGTVPGGPRRPSPP
jgi:hypothetical protein